MDDSRSDPRSVARRFYDILNEQDASRLPEVCATDMRGHASAGATLEEFTSNWHGFLAAFPDLRVSQIRYLVTEDDLVSSWLTYTGTHRDTFAGVPGTGRPVKFAAWDLMRIRDGRIVELTQYCDLFTILNQIGALPTATPPDTYEGVEQPVS